MPEFPPSKSGSRLSSIECPRCPRCQTRMALAVISPAPRGYDLRTFECAKCDRISTKLVPTDPMKTGDALRRLDGELKPPG
jgi:transposase-like protein